MSCINCGGELVTAPLESKGERGKYGPTPWEKITITRPVDLEEKYSNMSNFYDKTFGYDDPYHGGDTYRNDEIDNKLPEQGTEIEPILELAGQRPEVSVMVCKVCGKIQSLHSNLHDIYNAIEIVENWIEGEKEAMLAKQAAKKTKIRDEKRKNYEKQIAALQIKIDKLNDD
jgi:hypothetical protein